MNPTSTNYHVTTRYPDIIILGWPKVILDNHHTLTILSAPTNQRLEPPIKGWMNLYYAEVSSKQAVLMFLNSWGSCVLSFICKIRLCMYWFSFVIGQPQWIIFEIAFKIVLQHFIFIFKKETSLSQSIHATGIFNYMNITKINCLLYVYTMYQCHPIPLIPCV